MKYATRKRIHIDRAASAWLIRRSIDAQAEFVFVEGPDDVPEDAIPFDMIGVELSHHDGDCTFETLLKCYELDDPILWEIAKIVHEADLGDDRYDAPEARGMDVVLRGMSKVVLDDHQMVVATTPMFDGLYEWFRESHLLGHDPA